MNKITHLLTISLLLLANLAFSQQNGSLTPNQVNKKYRYETTDIPAYIQTADFQHLNYELFEKWLRENYDIDPELGFRFLESEKDQLGYEHHRFTQTYKAYPIFGSRYIVHSFNGKIKSMSGLAFNQVKASTDISIQESEALEIALSYIQADQYMWELEEEEKLLQQFYNDPAASYFPKAEMVLINPNNEFKQPFLRLAYKFDIYAHTPVSRAYYFVDAATGELLFVEPVIHTINTEGKANTKYSGVQTITVDSIKADSFILRESSRGKGVETYDLNNSTSYASAVDFVDDDNYWNNFNADKDEIATDAHWATQVTYDYYWDNFNRSSIDGKGFKLVSYLHYNTDYANAFWNGQWMTYGDGNSVMNPLVSIDIVGHEITHGLTSNTARLIYASESGALNEGFSDIFGNMIEYYGKPTASSWEMGENTGRVIRHMETPNSTGNPDTYGGSFWLNTNGCVPSSSNDNCGVHINSTVYSHWFYILVEGLKGTNDKGDAFDITGIGHTKASEIAFRNLTVYFHPSTDFQDARYYSIQSASDLYGNCSLEVNAVIQAWYAVGVGDSSRSVNFEANKTVSCAAPFNVEFHNLSDDFTYYSWDFGDGYVSTIETPTHTYLKEGKYTVKLKGFGQCGNDSITFEEYIVIDSGLPCIYTITGSGSHDTVRLCEGVLKDNGGDENYTGNIDGMVTIAPPGADKVILNFKSFAFEGDCDCDWLYIYDGPDMNSPLIGKYSGFELPEGGIVKSSGSSITVRQYTDPYKTFSGFELDWYCQQPNSPPIFDFHAKNTVSCVGKIQFNADIFTDYKNVEWDFGDGNTSSQLNPEHQYLKSGVYTVKLTASNDNGSESISKEEYIHINLPVAPKQMVYENCGPASFEMISTDSGEIHWFDSDTSKTAIHIGDTFTTPTLNQSRSYFIQEKVVNPPLRAGLDNKDVSTGGYYTNTNYHALIFETYKDIIIKSVKVYAYGLRDRNIVLKDKNGLVLYDTNITIENGEQRIDLNFKVPTGEGYELGCEPVAYLYRNNGGIDYPIIVPGVLSIYSNTAAQSGFDGYYYYFYDWEVIEPACLSSRTEVIAFINSNDPKSDFSYSIAGDSLEFRSSSTGANYYQWYFGDGDSASGYKLDQVYHKYSSDGNYDVTLKVSNACGNHEITKKVNTNSGFSEMTSASILVYPNPASGYLNVEITGFHGGQVQVRLSSVVGQTVYEKKFNGLQEKHVDKIDISLLTDGIYLLELISESKRFTRKVVIKSNN